MNSLNVKSNTATCPKEGNAMNLNTKSNFVGRTIGDVLDDISNIADGGEKGDMFEKLVSYVLPQIKDLDVRSVKEPRPDKGVDFVGTLNDGEKVAIQCKFFTANNIGMRDLLTFSREAVKVRKNVRCKFKWLVYGDRGPGREAKEVIKENDIRVVNFRQYSDIFIVDNSLPQEPKLLRELFPPQQDSVDATVKCLKNAKPGKYGERRCRLISACGTGKTFISLCVTKQLGSKKILYIAPSIALVGQAYREYKQIFGRDLRALVVNSDQTSGSNDSDDETSISEILCGVTTDPKEIAEFLRKPIGNDNVRAIFCTYQSLDKVSDAQRCYKASKFDIAVIDEAHRTAGVRKDDKDGQFMLIHDASKNGIQADFRLYMTATPKTYKHSAARRRAEENGIIAVDMGEIEYFGELAYNLSFKRAVEEGMLCNYKEIVMGVDERFLDMNAMSKLLDFINNESPEKRTRDEDIRVVLAVFAMMCAVQGYVVGNNPPKYIGSVLAFTNSISRSKDVKKLVECKEMKEWVAETGRRYFGAKTPPIPVEVTHVDGTHNFHQRKDALDKLGKGDAKKIQIVTNAKVCAEGVNLPTLSAVAFIEPRQSVIDNVQAIGRAMRKADGKECGYIIVPVLVPSGKTIIDTLDLDKARYRSLLYTLLALKSIDDGFNPDTQIMLTMLSKDKTLPELSRPHDATAALSSVSNAQMHDFITRLTKDCGLDDPGKNVEERIKSSMRRAGDMLKSAGAANIIADTIGTSPDNEHESCYIASIIIANACIMHKRLDETGDIDGLEKIESANAASNTAKALFHSWEKILEHGNNVLIFQDAAMLVNRMSDFPDMDRAIKVLTGCAMVDAIAYNELKYDHVGQLFQEVLGSSESQRSDGAFYTKKLSAHMLAGLTFDDDLIDYSNPAAVNDLKVIDPACGIGTLLTSALHINKSLAAKAQGLDEAAENKLHKEFVEKNIYAFDINRHSKQFTASNLTLGVQNTNYGRMNLFNLPNGPVEGKRGKTWDEVKVGAVEHLIDAAIGNAIIPVSSCMEGENATGNKVSVVLPNKFDAVVINPPFTDMKKQSEKYPKYVQDSMAARFKHIAKLLIQNYPQLEKVFGRSVQQFFMVLVTMLLRENGRLGMVIPLGVATSTKSTAQRQYIADNFHIEIVVTSHDPDIPNFSHDTDIHECLVIGRRKDNNDKPTRFVQLVKYPQDVKSADKLIAAIRNHKNKDVNGELLFTETLWPAEKMRAGDWSPLRWMNSKIMSAMDQISALPNLQAAEKIPKWWRASTSSYCVAFERIKNATVGDSFLTIDSKIMLKMQAKPESASKVKRGKEKYAERVRLNAKHMLVAGRSKTTSSRLIAIYSETPAMGEAFYPVDVGGKKMSKICVAFLNSSFGLIQFHNKRNTSLTYSIYQPTDFETILLPDPTTADWTPLLNAFNRTKGKEIQCPKYADDPVRKTLDYAVAKILGIDPAVTDQWRELLSQEPLFSKKPYDVENTNNKNV